MKNVAKWQTWFFWVGAIIVVGSHVYMLTSGLPEDQFTGHAVSNLVASALFIIVWFKHK